MLRFPSASRSALRRVLKSIYWRLPPRLRFSLNPIRYALVSRLAGAPGTAGARPTPATEAATPDWLASAQDAPRLAVLPCAFEFDELVNQRPINLAKFLASAGYRVVFVAWQWSPGERQSRELTEVWPGVVQVPLYDFLAHADRIAPRTANQSSIAILTFPAAQLNDAFAKLRGRGFLILYDILDDWEEFGRVGQAPWYRRQLEEQAVLAADRVFVVSAALRRKFQRLRRDIDLVGNGYAPQLIGGEASYLISRKAPHAHTVGYFGHLTDAWFDWELILDAARQRPHVTFEIIGYGMPENVVAHCAATPSIRLLGKVPPARLHEHAARWKAALIPFKPSALSEAVDPIKIYEYLHFGLNTIVTGLTHLRAMPGVHVVEQPGDFCAALDRVLRCGPDEPPEQAIRAVLRQSTWDARFDAMLATIKAAGSLAPLYED